MFVCICAGVRTSQVEEAIRNGAHTLKELREELDVLNYCGHCKCTLQSMLHEHKDKQQKTHKA